jgi:predicted DNA binding protein
MLLQSLGFGDQIIDEFDLLQISPVVYRHGWEYYRVIAFKHKDVKGLLQGFEGKGSKFEILSKVDFDESQRAHSP